jgi:N6-L-threonylcarbamoyladenine synthase
LIYQPVTFNNFHRLFTFSGLVKNIYRKMKVKYINDKKNASITILGIESSCDDTSAAIIRDGVILSNVVAGQKVHEEYGGVVPELASRAHQQNIIPVVDRAIVRAGIYKNEISAVAFTRGPGLLGSLLVGTSFAKGFSLAAGIPLIEVNHLQGHVLALFIKEKEVKYNPPKFPFLCLLVSGGNSQIILVHDYLHMEVIGQTIDDAAGEAFDKCAKVMGLPYPGGPHVDRLAKQGNPIRFSLSKPRIKGLDYSFSGLKTSFLYFLRDNLKENENFIEENLNDLCASLQHTIIDILMDKLKKAAKETGINEITVAGGVSANSGLRNALKVNAEKYHWNLIIPKFEYTMDNAAMIAITGYYKYLNGEFAGQDVVPFARTQL